MAVGWFLSPYKRIDSGGERVRACAMQDFDAQTAGWSEGEFLDLTGSPQHPDPARRDPVALGLVGGTAGAAVCKVNATNAVLNAIANDGRFQRVPGQLLDDPLSTLTNAQKTAIRNYLLDRGFMAQQITDGLGGDIGSKTVGDVLRFALTQRRRPRYDAPNDFVACDGPVDPTIPVEHINSTV